MSDRYDGPVIRPLGARLLVACALAVLAIGCGPASSASSSIAVPSAVASPAASPSASGSAGEPSTPASPAASVTTTETDWGTIWDVLPATFPVFPGAIPTEALDGPASGAFAVPAGALEATEFMQSALETAGYSTEAQSGPFEDGSYVIDSVGATSDCRVETRLAPLSGTTLMTVRLAAGCPFE
jgi:hypothetical protein